MIIIIIIIIMIMIIKQISLWRCLTAYKYT